MNLRTPSVRATGERRLTGRMVLLMLVAFFGTEQGGGSAFVGNLAGGYGDEGLVAARTEMMQPARQGLLARACFAAQQDRRVVRGQFFQLGAQRALRVGVTDRFDLGMHATEQATMTLLQGAGFERALQADQQLGQRDRFLDEIPGT